MEVTGEQLILEENVDDNFIPSEMEIMDYAMEIGIDPEKEPELMWLAREGIFTPLPKEWKPCQDVNGDIYYFNFSTGMSSWDHPCDEYYRQMVDKERERLAKQGTVKAQDQKDKKKKKKTKEKKKDNINKDKKGEQPALKTSGGLNPVQAPLGSLAPVQKPLLGLTPIQMPARGLAPLQPLSGTLAPIRGPVESLDNLGVSPRSSMDSLGFLKGPKKNANRGQVGGGKKEENAFGGEAGIGDDVENDENPLCAAEFLKHLHLDIDEDDFQFEESEASENIRELQVTEDTDEDGATLDKDPALSALPSKMSSRFNLMGLDNLPPQLENKKTEVSALPNTFSSRFNVMDIDDLPPLLDNQKSEHADPPVFPVHDDVDSKTNKDKGKTDETTKSHEAWSEEAKVSLAASGDANVIQSLINETPEDSVHNEHSLNVSNPEADEQLSSGKFGFEKEASKASSSSVPLMVVEKPVKDGHDSEGRVSDCLKNKPQHELEGREKQLQKDNDDALEELKKQLEKELTEQEEKLQEEKEERLRKLRNKLQQEESDTVKQLEEELKKTKRTVEEQHRDELQREEARLKDEYARTLVRVRESLRQETEEEERKLKLQKEKTLQEQNALFFSMERDRLEADKEGALKALREELEVEKQQVLEKLKETHLQELDELKSAVQEKHGKDIDHLKKELVETQMLEKNDVTERLKKAQLRQQQVDDYEKQLSELMRERRTDVEREHVQKLDEMKADHTKSLHKIREDHMQEESNLRRSLMDSWKEERQRLQERHEEELSEMRRDQERRLEQLTLVNAERERDWKEEHERLQQNILDLSAKKLQLQNEVEVERKKTQMRKEEQDAFEKEIQAKNGELQERMARVVEALQKEEKSLEASMHAARRDLQEMERQKAELAAELDALKGEGIRLKNKLGELQESVTRQEGVEAAFRELSEDTRGELRAEDLTGPEVTRSSVEPGSSNAEDQQIENKLKDISSIRQYIAQEECSLQRAQRFITEQMSSLRHQDNALRSARRSQRTLGISGTTAEGNKSHRVLEQEAKHLAAFRSTMRKGFCLLREKEEKLGLLKESVMDVLSDEESQGVPLDGKRVTFDVDMSSDDLSSEMDLDFSSQQRIPQSAVQGVEVQHLSSSIQRLSRELTNVLTLLGQAQPSLTFGTRFATGAFPAAVTGGVPISAYFRPSQMGLGSSAPLAHAWGPVPASVTQTVDEMMAEKWRKYFPGGIPPLGSTSTIRTENMMGYLSASEQVRRFQQAGALGVGVDPSSLQDSIAQHRKWLHDFRKDSKSTTMSLSGRPLQLGLDEHNSIHVYQQ
ncbi:centrosomal protein of 164 kDa isoform X2 [Petromyzon marinus]|uniref:Centrosomal protein of 164 kDa n=1 Tax=Petromyzon marinus TaxID=7757 RepID=A0AAJ7X400_PETMA|nr:centrosomal protein of 164 kDa isoform X2 [Petromyzon marinus]